MLPQSLTLVLFSNLFSFLQFCLMQVFVVVGTQNKLINSKKQPTMLSKLCFELLIIMSN